MENNSGIKGLTRSSNPALRGVNLEVVGGPPQTDISLTIFKEEYIEGVNEASPHYNVGIVYGGLQ